MLPNINKDFADLEGTTARERRDTVVNVIKRLASKDQDNKEQQVRLLQSVTAKFGDLVVMRREDFES